MRFLKWLILWLLLGLTTTFLGVWLMQTTGFGNAKAHVDIDDGAQILTPQTIQTMYQMSNHLSSNVELHVITLTTSDLAVRSFDQYVNSHSPMNTAHTAYLYVLNGTKLTAHFVVAPSSFQMPATNHVMAVTMSPAHGKQGQVLTLFNQLLTFVPQQSPTVKAAMVTTSSHTSHLTKAQWSQIELWSGIFGGLLIVYLIAISLLKYR